MRDLQTQDAKLRAHFTEQATWCRALGSPFTADLIAKMAHDYDAGGPVHSLICKWQGNPRKDALALRLCAALHGATIQNKAPDLAKAYPAKGKPANVETLWQIAGAFLERQSEWVTSYLRHAPQTNETARTIALLPGFLDLAAQFDMPMNLLELGASAGLNQNWDQFNYETGTWSRAGTSNVLITTDWHGPPPKNPEAQINISRRSGCDLNPLNIRDPEATSRLRSYIWPDQIARLERFDAALQLAQDLGTKVDQADALDWLRQKLEARPEGELTVIYHSIFLQYPPTEIIEAIKNCIETAGHAASANRPLAWLCFEPEALFEATPNSPGMITRLHVWPERQAQTMGVSDGHVTRFEAVR